MSDPFSSPAQFPLRPEPQLRARDRLLRQVRARWDSWRSRGHFDSEPHDLVASDAGRRDRAAVVLTALIAVGSALLALGSLYAWQTWSQRSSPPIDDLLPVLVTGDSTPQGVAAEPETKGQADEPALDEPEPQSGPVAAAPAVDAAGLAETADLVVHVSGAVQRPGVVQLPPGSRVYEAVDEAGGATATADLERVNLAAPLGDGERIHVPRVGEDELPVLVQPAPASGALVAPGGAEIEEAPLLVDINAASEVELQMLPGVGPSTAQAIVRTRNERGPYLQVDELREVPGIGETKLAALLPHVVVIAP